MIQISRLTGVIASGARKQVVFLNQILRRSFLMPNLNRLAVVEELDRQWGSKGISKYRDDSTLDNSLIDKEEPHRVYNALAGAGYFFLCNTHYEHFLSHKFKQKQEIGKGNT